MTIIDKAIQEINSRYGSSFSDLTINGKIHRGPNSKEEHIWYVVNEWTYNQFPYVSIKYGSWKHGDEHTVNSWDHKDEDKNFKKAYTKHVQQSKVAMDLEKQERHAKCKAKWKPIYDKLPITTVVHDYLKFKGIDDVSGCKINNNVLVIPAYNSVKGFVGVQQIYFDIEKQKFEKKFSTGIEIKGAFSPLMPFKNAEYAIVCEGFATGKSIQKAFPMIPVIVVFSANNIAPAIEHIRNINPKIRIMIAADNDKADQNGKRAGEFYAKSAASKIPAVAFRVVKFSVSNNSWSDFNDLHQFESIDKVIEQLTIDPAEFTEVICLGYKGDTYFYTSSENTQIISLSSSAHANKMNLLSMVGLPYWYKNYGIKDPESGDYIGVDYTRASAEMMEKCRKKGFFDPDKMRGRGVWLDQERIVINTGEKLYEDGRQIGSLSTKFHYLRTAEIDFNPTQPASDDEMGKLLAVFGSLTYKNRNDFLPLSAWVIQAQIFAVLPWRFHIWLLGDKGAGKSTVLQWLEGLIIKASPNLNSSAAGIRQDIESDTVPVLYDESEPDSFRLKEIIEMARQSSSNTGFETRRGTPSGKALVYNTQALFMMGSTQKGIEKAADMSRFFIVEMMKANQTTDQYEEMISRISYFSEMKKKIFTRAVLNAKTVRKNFFICQKYLKDKKIEARYADQLSSMLSCFWLYISTETLTSDDIEYLLTEYKILDSDYMEQNKTPDFEECFNSIMSMKVDNQGTSVYRCVEVMRGNQDGERAYFENLLGSMGIRYFPEHKAIFIANKSLEIQKKIPSSFLDYTSLLKRSDKFFTPPNQKPQLSIPNYRAKVRGVFVKVDD